MVYLESASINKVYDYQNYPLRMFSACHLAGVYTYPMSCLTHSFKENKIAKRERERERERECVKISIQCTCI